LYVRHHQHPKKQWHHWVLDYGGHTRTIAYFKEVYYRVSIAMYVDEWGFRMMNSGGSLLALDDKYGALLVGNNVPIANIWQTRITLVALFAAGFKGLDSMYDVNNVDNGMITANIGNFYSAAAPGNIPTWHGERVQKDVINTIAAARNGYDFPWEGWFSTTLRPWKAWQFAFGINDVAGNDANLVPGVAAQVGLANEYETGAWHTVLYKINNMASGMDLTDSSQKYFETEVLPRYSPTFMVQNVETFWCNAPPLVLGPYFPFHGHVVQVTLCEKGTVCL